MAEHDGLIPVDSVEDQSAPRCVRCSNWIIENPTGNLFCRDCIEDIWEHAESYGGKQKTLRVVGRRNKFLPKPRAA